MKFLRILLRVLIVIVFLASIGFGVYYYNTEYQKKEKYLVKTIVQGNLLLSTEEVLEIATVPLKGTPLPSIDIKGIENRIKGLEYIDSVSVEIDDQNLRITVKEEQPISYITLNDGSLKFLTHNASVLPLREIFPTVDLPVVQGIKFPLDSTVKPLLKEAVSLVNGIRNYGDNYIYTITSEIVYKPEIRAFLIVTSEKQEILIGNSNNLDDKLQKLLYFWNADKISTATTRSKTIDLRWNGQVILKSKKPNQVDPVTIKTA
jgi:hypothetical protein